MSFNYNNLKLLANLSEKAIRSIKKTIDSLVWDSIDYNNKAFELFEEGRLEESIFYYDLALNAEPGYVTALHGKGTVLCVQKKYMEAIHCCNLILENYPDEEETMNNKASILFKMKNYDASYLCFKAATEITPENPIIWSNMGKVLYKMNRIQEAMNCWEIAYTLNSETSWDDHVRFVFLGFIDQGSPFSQLPRDRLITIIQYFLDFKIDVVEDEEDFG